eukprot:TRINITY_DN2415_c0_g3_i1.p1 TRINITY_DN2415_c0_g3~~TRINITY_DN2415_c0_g3_i1.p1  ORF type:complete len:787 (-),score=27.26 TRINITY_DN2415_c0_g3_i1:1975-4248(-)
MVIVTQHSCTFNVKCKRTLFYQSKQTLAFKFFTRRKKVECSVETRTQQQQKIQGNLSKQRKQSIGSELSKDVSKQLQGDLKHCEDIYQLQEIIHNSHQVFDYIHLSQAFNLLSRFQTRQTKQIAQRIASQLINRYVQIYAKCNSRSLSVMVQTLGKLQFCPNPKFLGIILQNVKDLQKEFSSQGCVMMLHGLANMQNINSDSIKKVKMVLCTLILERFFELVDDWEPQHVSQSIWALGKLQLPLKQQHQKIFSAQVNKHIKQFSEQNLSNLLLGFANQGWKCHENPCPGKVANQLLKTLQQQQSDIPYQAISNALWSTAKMHLDYHKFTDFLCMKILSEDGNLFKEQELSNIVWSLSEIARYEYEPTQRIPQVFMHLIHPIINKVQEFTTQGLSNVILAYARFFQMNSQFQEGIELYRAIGSQIKSRIKEMEMQHVSNSIWSFSISASILTRIYDEQLFQLFADEMCARIDRALPQDIASVLYGFGKCGYRCEHTIQVLADYATNNLDKFNTQEVVNSYFGIVNIRYEHDLFKQKFYERILSSELFDWDPQALSNTLWAFSVQDNGYNEAVFVKLASYINDFQEARSTEDVRLQSPQIYQSYLLCKFKHDTIWWEQISPELQQQCMHMWQRSVLQQRYEEPSDFQQAIFDILGELGIKQRKMEYTIEDSLASIDIAFVIGGKRVAIEVDGPSHFTLSQPYLPLAKTVARDCLLQGYGWNVHSIPYYDWRQLKTQDNQREYVKNSVGKFLMELRKKSQ